MRTGLFTPKRSFTSRRERSPRTCLIRWPLSTAAKTAARLTARIGRRTGRDRRPRGRDRRRATDIPSFENMMKLAERMSRHRHGVRVRGAGARPRAGSAGPQTSSTSRSASRILRLPRTWWRRQESARRRGVRTTVRRRACRNCARRSRNMFRGTRGIPVSAATRLRGAGRQADHLFPDDGAAGAGR